MSIYGVVLSSRYIKQSHKVTMPGSNEVHTCVRLILGINRQCFTISKTKLQTHPDLQVITLHDLWCCLQFFDRPISHRSLEFQTLLQATTSNLWYNPLTHSSISFIAQLATSLDLQLQLKAFLHDLKPLVL